MNPQRPQIDSQLRSELGAAPPDRRVEAVLTLAYGEESAEPSAPQAVERLVAEMLARVCDATGIREDAYEVNVFANLDAFAIAAPRKFLERLLDEPGVESAIANRRDANGER